ncbi:MAG: hypothetical protein PHU68_01210 [Paludibacter sp.]|nr:hypothetical protein [Paludibacter sp.]
MKKVIYGLIVIVFWSCTSTNKISYQLNSLYVDYNEYHEKGFFVSESNSVSFDYQSIGSIIVQSREGFEIVGSTLSAGFNKYGSVSEIEVPKYGKYKNASLKEAFDELYKIALEKGANGVINFKSEYRAYNPEYNNLEIWVLTGMLIKM